MQPPNDFTPEETPQSTPHTPPIPPPDGTVTPPGSGVATSPPGRPQIDLNVISRAWALLQPNLGTWIVAFLIFLAINFVIVGVLSQITRRASFMLVANFIPMIVAYFLFGGLYRMAIKQVRGQTPDINDMFSITDVLPALLVASLLVGAATAIGALFCILPGYLVMGLLLFAIPLVVDKRMEAVPAITLSLDTLKPQMGMAFVFALVVGLLGGVGALLCGVGVLITGPLALLSAAVLYNDFFPENGPTQTP